MAYLNLRIDEEDKCSVEKVLDKLDLTMTTAVKLFLNAVIREQAIPFNITLSTNPQGRVIHCMLDEVSGEKQMDTHIFAETLFAFQMRNAFGAKTTRVTDNPVVDLVLSIDGTEYACIVKGRQFSNNESLQNKLQKSELAELNRYSQKNGCTPRVVFVMIDSDGAEGNTYAFDPTDLDDLCKAGVKGITGSMETEGEIRVSNARRNRQDLMSNERIVAFSYRFEGLNNAANLFGTALDA